MDFFLQQKLGILKTCASLNLWKLCFAFIVLVSHVAKVCRETKHIFGDDLAVKKQNKVIVNKIICVQQKISQGNPCQPSLLLENQIILNSSSSCSNIF